MSTDTDLAFVEKLDALCEEHNVKPRGDYASRIIAIADAVGLEGLRPSEQSIDELLAAVETHKTETAAAAARKARKPAGDKPAGDKPAGDGGTTGGASS